MIDGCPVVTFEQTRKKLEKLEREICARHGIVDESPREIISLLVSTGTIPEDELVMDWQCELSTYVQFRKRLL